MAVIQRPEAVGDIQEILSKLGYDTGTTDQMWGKDTSAGFNHFVHDVQAHLFADKPEERDGYYGAKTHEALLAQVTQMYGDRLSADEVQRLTGALGQMIEKVDMNGKPHPLGRPLVDRLHTPQDLENFESKITPTPAEAVPEVAVETAPEVEVAPEIEAEQPVEVAPDTTETVPVETAPVVPVTQESLLDGIADIEKKQEDLLRTGFPHDPAEGRGDALVDARVENMRDPVKFDRFRAHMLEQGNTEAVQRLDDFKALEDSRRIMLGQYETLAAGGEPGADGTVKTPDQRISEAFAAVAEQPVDPALQAALDKMAAEKRAALGVPGGM